MSYPILRPFPERRDILVFIWRLFTLGRHDEARERLLFLWSGSIDGLAERREGRVAVRLFERLGFSTDDPEAWSELPDPLTIYRAGGEGIAWTVDRGVAEQHAGQEEERVSVRASTISKADALAFITRYGEAEVLVRPSALPPLA